MKKSRTRGISSKQMSKLHWNLRKEGLTYKQALTKTGIAKAISKKHKTGPQKKIKKEYPYEDFDGDKKINKYDCQPLNKNKQDKIGIVGSRNASKEQEERTRELVRTLKEKDCVVSGGCYAGPDKWAEEEAKKRKLETIIKYPTKNTAEEYHNRNKKIAEESDEIHGFLGPGPHNPNRYAGTEQTIREAKEKGKKTTIHFEDGTTAKYNY